MATLAAVNAAIHTGAVLTFGAVHLAEAIREGRLGTVRGREGELLVAREELERVPGDGLNK